MKYEVRFTQIHPRGCQLIYTQDIVSDSELEEITVYNKKLNCFMTRERIE